MTGISRRSFVRAGVAGAAALVLPARAEGIIADPYAPTGLRIGRTVRVRGSVRAAGRGIAGVRVTDGLSVVSTDSNGAYTLISDGARDFVYITVPAGFEIPCTASGTAVFHERIVPHGDEAEAYFELRRAPYDDHRHATLFLADIQTEDAREMQWFHEQTVPDVVETVNRLNRPTVGVAVGDIMFDNLHLYPDYERAVQRMGVPFFQVVGNHDLDQEQRTDEVSTTTFSRHFGPRWYSFERGSIHYVVLDDVFWHGAGYIGYLDAAQLTWLANDLAAVEPGRTVVVGLHIPVVGSRHVREGNRSPSVSGSITNRQALYRLLEPYRAHVVCGHTHESDHNIEHGVHEHVIGTVCGAWWSGPICADGTPNGYAIFSADGETVSWQFKSTGFAPEHQIRAYGAGSDPAAPDHVIANVWDWDPSWTVVLHADGTRASEMSQRVARDPLSVELHAGADLPARRTWVDPYPTRHVFYAPAPEGARELCVEAVDGLGRRYSAVVPAP